MISRTPLPPITPLGVELRRIRLAHGHRILDMAKVLGLGPADLSSVETGCRHPELPWVDLIAQEYRLTEVRAWTLRKLFEQQMRAPLVERPAPPARKGPGPWCPGCGATAPNLYQLTEPGLFGFQCSECGCRGTRAAEAKP